MERLQYILMRILKAGILILLIAVLSFLIVRLAPGDPASVIAGESGAADPIYMEQLRKQFGLDDPLSTQLKIHLKRIVQLDLGFSHRHQLDVSVLIFDRVGATLLLTGTGFLIAVLGGIFLGAISALNKDGFWDRLITGSCVLMYATPLYLIGVMGVLIFSAQLNWLPSYGAASIIPPPDWLGRLYDRGLHLLLPAMTLGIHYAPIYARLMRASMNEVQNQEFVRLAQAKGLPAFRVATAHVMRNSLLPIITFAGVHASNLVGGSILVETIFAWPGIGRLALDSMLVRDYNTLLGVFFICSALAIIFNLIIDLLYTVIDPRIDIEA